VTERQKKANKGTARDADDLRKRFSDLAREIRDTDRQGGIVLSEVDRIERRLREIRNNQ
jgi:hypothetical protein